MYFFYNRPVKVGDRNKFKEEAIKNYGIKLEIVDAVAIAEFLADPELLWIAEKYLSLPSEVSLAPSGSPPAWYSSLISRPESELPLNADTFYQLKSALRYARADSEHHSEIPRLVHRIQLFRSHPDRVISRKAFYEEFVAVLRGLNAAQGYEPRVIEYLSAIPNLSEPPEVEDAAILLSYVNGACIRKILVIDVPIRSTFRDELLTRLNSMISSEPSFVNCSLLFTKGYLLLMEAALETPQQGTMIDVLAQSVENAI